MAEPELTRDLRRVQQLTRVLDTAITVPGTRVRLGLDALLGLIPGAGDALSAALSAYPLVIAVRHRLPGAVITRLLGNIVLDAIVGTVPIIGDLFDIGFKANVRNRRLIERYAEQPARVTGRSRAALWIVGGAVALTITSVVALGIWIVRWAFESLPW